MQETMTRDQRLIQWLSSLYSSNIKLISVSGDASFRKYYRFNYTGQSLIVMDSSPELENNQPFIDVSGLLKEYALHVPHILHQDMEQGFFVISDLGDRLLLDELNADSVDHFYPLAFEEIIKLHTVDTKSLPKYDSALLQREMQLFSDWYLTKHKNINLSAQAQTSLSNTYELLEQNALDQPQVFVHRDYHSRNLMIVDEHTLGIIDYQDAVLGPITYDLVSLLRDCYIDWPPTKIEEWLQLFLSKLPAEQQVDFAQFSRWFDLMGVQRHLKAVGIFCRLNYRDNKPAYLNDIPRTMNYLLQVSKQYDELQPLHQLLSSIK